MHVILLIVLCVVTWSSVQAFYFTLNPTLPGAKLGLGRKWLLGKTKSARVHTSAPSIGAGGIVGFVTTGNEALRNYVIRAGELGASRAQRCADQVAEPLPPTQPSPKPQRGFCSVTHQDSHVRDVEPQTLLGGGTNVGEWEGGKPHVRGYISSAQGRTATSQRREGKRTNETGAQILDTTPEKRTWVTGTMKGHGENTSDAGYEYRGWFRNRKENGRDTLAYPDGKVRVDEFRGGKAHDLLRGRFENGTGVVELFGCVHNGSSTNGKLEGNGEYVTYDGYKYSAEFCDGSARSEHGRGTIVYPDGSTHVGEFMYGKPHGPGKCTDAKGNVLEGEFERGSISNGAGVIQMADFVWNGTWVNGKLDGYGEVVYPGGFKYCGMFRKEQQHGSGTLTFPDGETRVGEFWYGEMNGLGTRTRADGSVYRGMWVNGQMQGHGESVVRGYHYTGEFYRGRYEGLGTKTYPDGTVSTGMFWNGTLHGQAKVIHPDGSALEGIWYNGKLVNGTGVRKLSSGVVTGTFVNGLPEGACIQVNVSGFVYVGDFRRGVRHGTGTRREPNGATYDGQWANGLYHGQGTYTSEEGYVLQGEWRNGKIWNGMGVNKHFPTAKGKKASNRKGANKRAPSSFEVILRNGTFVNGEFEGNGTETHPDGSTHAGGWVRGLKHGWGVCTSARGYVVEGDWKQTVLHTGAGVMEDRGRTFNGTWAKGAFANGEVTYPDERKHCGEFQGGKPHGFGTQVYPDGSMYVGGWLRSVPHGAGTRTDADGRVWTEKWRRGVLLVRTAASLGAGDTEGSS